MKQFLLLLFLFPALVFSQGKLKKAKENLNEESANTSQGTRNVRATSSSSSDDSDDFSVLDDPDLRFFLFRLVFWSTIGITVGEAQERDLNPYPYFYDDEGEYAKELSDTGRKQSLTLGTNYIFNTINGYEFNALYKPLPILGIKASHIHFSEKSRTSKDFLDITSLSLNYYRVREKNISLWWGIGASYVGNEVRKLGFSYNLGIEIYPVKPISLHASWQESFINDRDIGVFKSQIKYHIKNKAIFAGYHVYQIAGEAIKAPTIGFQITF